MKIDVGTRSSCISLTLGKYEKSLLHRESMLFYKKENNGERMNKNGQRKAVEVSGSTWRDVWRNAVCMNGESEFDMCVCNVCMCVLSVCVWERLSLICVCVMCSS